MLLILNVLHSGYGYLTIIMQQHYASPVSSDDSYMIDETLLLHFMTWADEFEPSDFSAERTFVPN